MDFMPNANDCQPVCSLFFKMIEACPILSHDNFTFNFDYIWQSYMIVSSCLPYAIMFALLGHWIISKLSYCPSCLMAGIFTVLRSVHVA